MVVAIYGSLNGAGTVGGENRTGGDAANGIPRNLFTTTVAKGSEVVVPITTPEAIVTVGAAATATATCPNRTATSWVKRIVVDSTQLHSEVILSLLLDLINLEEIFLIFFTMRNTASPLSTDVSGMMWE